jgi:LuxR family transcriptional regulator, maltose regulon positive regulatory protein
MQRPGLFLRTKLMPPRPVTDLLARPRLTETLKANLEAPMTLVAADAGCGKTTLIAEFVRSQERPVVWYQLDHTDADPAVFLGYVARGIKAAVPAFGDAIFDYLSEANEDLLRFPERGADLLINEILQSVERPLILVLDDYHHIGVDTPVHRVVDRVLQYSSDLVHVMITTRDLPPLAMMKRRAKGAVHVLTRDDLLFTDEEVRELFRSTLGVSLDDRQVAEYRDRTHGWVTGLQLVRQAAEEESLAEGRPVDLVEMLKRSERDIFDYFAEEVFSRETEATRKLMMSLSLLESLPLDTCSMLFRDQRCSAVLPELAQRNVFLTVAGDGKAGEEYRFHPLFRDFLLRRLRSEMGRDGLAAERKRIADVLLLAGHWEQAIPFLLDAEDFESAAHVVAEHGAELIDAGALLTLDSLTKRIPPPALESFPTALLHTAEVARIRGDMDRASGLLRRAVELMSGTDPAGEAEALHSLASIARRRGRLAEALAFLDSAEKTAAAGSETLMKCANTRGLCLISEGKWPEAEQQFRFALELAERLGHKQYQGLIMHNLALPPGFRGDFGEALRWFRRIFRDGEDGKQLPQEAIGHLNVARLHLYRGEFEATAQHLERSLELCQIFDMRSLLPEVFEAYANYYRETGDDAHAEEFYERAAKAYDDAEIDITTRELNEERARFLFRRGDTLRARALLESLIEARESRGETDRTLTPRIALAGVDLAEKKFDGLAERLTELVENFRSRDHYYDEANAALLLAETLLAAGKENEAVPLVNRVLDLSARFDYDFWLRREIRRNPAIFSIDEIAERLPADLRGELTAPTEPAKQTAITVSESPVTDLTINVLGPVEIFRDRANPFAPDAWTTRRARDIFCYITTSRHRRVAKDVLIDAFWPDDDPAAVEKNFHPTISHIRKALNSRQTLKQNFLIYRDGAYQLNPDLTYMIDTEDFERLVADAEAAKREKNNTRLRASLEGAHTLYRGEFMPGVYESWAEERRGYYTEQSARVTGALAKLSLAERRLADAQRYAAESLKLDPYREDMHRLTLKVLAAQNKLPAAKKHLNEMSALLKQELGVTPSPETMRLAAELGLE